MTKEEMQAFYELDIAAAEAGGYVQPLNLRRKKKNRQKMKKLEPG